MIWAFCCVVVLVLWWLMFAAFVVGSAMLGAIKDARRMARRRACQAERIFRMRN